MLQGRSAIDKVVMILGSRDGVDYRYIADKLKKKTGVDFKMSMEENRKALMAGADSAIEKEIVETAILMDGNLDHTGLHAAGVIISDNDDLSEYIPVAWDAGFETWKTQCDMVQCENKHGLLKMDVLLLTTLDIITYTLRLIKKTHPDVEIDIENLPMEEKVFKSIYATGDTKAVFQFESGGMVKFLRQMQPTCIEDIIAANAMYRPGPMDSIPDYIEAKFSGNVQYMCPELEPILSNTYGQIIYQEQVMAIFRELAGYSLGRSDLVRRAMAKKHLDELVAEREYFINGSSKYDAEHPDAPLNIRGCVPSGISAEVANKMFDRMLAFAAYAFNKSHAAAYSVTSYMTAWLKYYYPTEFFCAALNYTGAQKEIPSIVADAKRHGIQVLRPDINKSEFNFSVEGKNIRFGLSFLANAKSRANVVIDGREGGFKTFKEFIKVRPGKSLAESCILAGACDSYIANNPDKRLALLEAYTELSAMYDKIVAAEARLETEMKSDAKIKAEATLNELIRKWDEYQLPKVQPMTLIQRLNEEQKYTSIYFSGNPMDSFDVQSGDYVDIANLEEGKNVWIAAAISEERMLKTKKDSLPMMSGKFTDASGSVDFIIFPKTYAQVVDSLTTVMAFNGRLAQNNDEEPQFVVSSVKALPQKNKKIVVWFDDYKATQAIVKSGAVDRTTGYPAFLVGKNSKMYATGVHITEEYAIENNLKYKITT